MSDNGLKAEGEHLQAREEGGDDEVRAWPSRCYPPPHLIHAVNSGAQRDEMQTKNIARAGTDKKWCAGRDISNEETSSRDGG